MSDPVAALTIYILLGIYAVVFLFSVPVYLFLRGREPIRSRGWQFSLVTALMTCIDIVLRAIG